MQGGAPSSCQSRLPVALMQSVFELGSGLNIYAYVSSSPLEGIDPAGLFCSQIHIGITYNAMRNAGASMANSLAVAMHSALVDVLPTPRISQSVSSANRHAMARPSQTEDEAREKTQELIERNIRKCTREGLANALHAAQDSPAVGHRYRVYDGSVGIAHMLSDCFPAQRDEIVAQLNSNDVLRRAKAICGCLP